MDFAESNPRAHVSSGTVIRYIFAILYINRQEDSDPSILPNTNIIIFLLNGLDCVS